MAKLTQKKVSATHRVLVFGPPKTGKTELAGRLSEHFNILLFDLEKGFTTLLKLPEEWQERIEVVSLPDTRSYPIGIETMLKVIKGGPVEICEDHGKVGCMLCRKDKLPMTKVELNSLGKDWIVIVDSLTQLTNSAIANITKNQPDDYKLQFDDWGHLGKLMDIFLSHVQQAEYNIVCISHETEVEMEDGRNKLVPTAGSRNFSRNTAKYFDHVVYCEIKNRKHVFASSTTYGNNIMAGSRTSVAMEKDDMPSLLRIFKPELFPDAPTPAPKPATNGEKAVSNLASMLAAKKASS